MQGHRFSRFLLQGHRFSFFLQGHGFPAKRSRKWSRKFHKFHEVTRSYSKSSQGHKIMSRVNNARSQNIGHFTRKGIKYHVCSARSTPPSSSALISIFMVRRKRNKIADEYFYISFIFKFSNFECLLHIEEGKVFFAFTLFYFYKND